MVEIKSIELSYIFEETDENFSELVFNYSN